MLTKGQSLYASDEPSITGLAGSQSHAIVSKMASQGGQELVASCCRHDYAPGSMNAPMRQAETSRSAKLTSMLQLHLRPTGTAFVSIGIVGGGIRHDKVAGISCR